MKAVVAAFNQEKALVGAFFVITNLRMQLFEALLEAVSELSAVLEAELARGGVAGVSFLFGATVHSAREVYCLTVPDNFAASGEDSQPSKRYVLIVLN